MKKLAAVTIPFLLVGCEHNLPSKEVEGKEFRVSLPNTKTTITEYKIDGCQYFGDLGGDSRDNFLTHKGNCSNPIHNTR